jgi:FkbM family methyltransferase
VIDLLLRTYALAERSGALRVPAFEWLFVRSYFVYKRLFEDVFARLVRERPELFRGGHVVDVGANAGYTARVFARAIEAPYRVYAFEPDEINFRRLTRFARNDRIVPMQSAAGEREGTIELWHNDAHPGDHRVAAGQVRQYAGVTNSVPITTIDTFARTLEHPIRFIKIDVQGYEPAVLRGMRDTLRGDVVVALEFCPSMIRALGFEPDEVFDALRGFDIQRLGDESRGYVDLLCIKTAAP